MIKGLSFKNKILKRYSGHFLFIVSLNMVLSIMAQPVLSANEKTIFLHHSTGGVIYYDGDVYGWFESYNNQNSTNYQIDDRYYPDSPYPWNNYPYDYWNLWVNGACDPYESTIHCLEQLSEDYDVVIFKNCFPVSDIEEDTGTPNITSERKSLENYKLQYSAVRDKLTEYPNTLFIMWTGAPLHRLATTEEKGLRARSFANWVKNDMLATGTFSNIKVFDYFDLTAGEDNFLKYNYEISHSDSDSHPNTQAAQDVAPLFAQFIVDSIEAFFTSPSYVISTSSIPSYGGIITCNPNPVSSGTTSNCSISVNPGYSIDSIDGTCGGALNYTYYTTDPITADCTVTAHFSVSGGDNGSNATGSKPFIIPSNLLLLKK